MKISIIIPALNEEDYIGRTLEHTQNLQGNFEIIVSDGGSTDRTCQIVKKYEMVRLISSEKGRANQMNAGADIAKGEILLFLHADTLLPENACSSVVQHLEKNNNIGGSFRLNFDQDHFLLKIYSWCSKFSAEVFTYGDHAIFMQKEIFEEIQGYKKIPFLEDIEIQKRLRKAGKFRKINAAVTTSARRFEKMGTFKQLTMDFLILVFYNLGVSPRRLKKFYKDHGS